MHLLDGSCKNDNILLLGIKIFCSLTSIRKKLFGTGPVAQRLSSHVPLLGGLGFTGSDPGCGHGMPCCGRHPTYKVEEDGHGC